MNVNEINNLMVFHRRYLNIYDDYIDYKIAINNLNSFEECVKLYTTINHHFNIKLQSLYLYHSLLQTNITSNLLDYSIYIKNSLLISIEDKIISLLLSNEHKSV